MKISKDILRRIKPQGSFNADRLINNRDEMNANMERTIKANEEKVAQGRQRVLRSEYGKILTEDVSKRNNSDEKGWEELFVTEEDVRLALDNTEKDLTDIPTGLIDFRKMLDGEPVNINPVKDVEDSEIKFYGVIGVFNSAFFENEFDLKQYLATQSSEKSFSSSYMIEYIRNFAGRTDVIAITGIGKKSKTKYYCAIDEEGYAEYNSERSIYKGEYVWEYNYGSYLVPMYDELRSRGINFENDVYGKINDRNERILKMVKERKQNK